MYKNNGNAKFLQCSNNIILEGHDNPEKKIWELKQIYINNEQNRILSINHFIIHYHMEWLGVSTIFLVGR